MVINVAMYVMIFKPLTLLYVEPVLVEIFESSSPESKDRTLNKRGPSFCGFDTAKKVTKKGGCIKHIE